ncbi:hypothetical protein Ahy_B09g098861 [Arachis hypogaea]|uniref:Aminotransferase-like plant mobile domain-containing protein n=1 Tax=Arachis hypogaea TaxID=3818 RepID=A0A444XSE0_ARAHY|nr:hypothetical protein Ahy_B09g098861 [Arachis hypogaea]
MRRQHGMPLDDKIIPYLQIAGLAHFARLNDHWFRLDEPLVNAFVEWWLPETHTFHMPFRECMVTLQDVAYYTLIAADLHGIGSRSYWMCCIQQTALIDEEIVRRYTRAYIMILLSTQLFGDKSSTCMHIWWLPYVARLEDMGGYS